MNVLLINAPVGEVKTITDKQIPLGLLYLGSVLKKMGNSIIFCDIHNAQVSSKISGTGFHIVDWFTSYIKTCLIDFSPGFIGIGVHYSGRFPGAIQCATILKERFPQCPIAIGGIHPTIFAKEIIDDYECIDYVVIGEGEESFPELITYHYDSRDFSNLDGIAYREDGKTRVNEKTRYIEIVDTIPFPAYELIDLKDYYYDTSGQTS